MRGQRLLSGAGHRQHQRTADVLYNRSLPGRLFDTLDEAREWLLSDEL